MDGASAFTSIFIDFLFSPGGGGGGGGGGEATRGGYGDTRVKIVANGKLVSLGNLLWEKGL